MGSLKDKFAAMNLRSEISIMKLARNGIQPEVFYEFARAINMPDRNLASIINLSSRTISNYKDAQRKLDAPAAEHLLKLIALYIKGEVIFGDVPAFSYWLEKPFWNSEDRPLGWLNTGGGVDLVSDELDRLAQGYPA